METLPTLLAKVKKMFDLRLMPSAEENDLATSALFRPSVPPLSGSNAFKLISNCFITANDVAKLSG